MQKLPHLEEKDFVKVVLFEFPPLPLSRCTFFQKTIRHIQCSTIVVWMIWSVLGLVSYVLRFQEGVGQMKESYTFRFLPIGIFIAIVGKTRRGEKRQFVFQLFG